MTALHPLETRERYVGVLAQKYPLNEVCGHPLCDKPAESAHHIFARSKIGNSSWFVAPEQAHRFVGNGKNGVEKSRLAVSKEAIPHVIGLCGHGTAGHHGDAESHEAWIKLHEDGLFYWWERDGDTWKEVGPLDPQPGSRIKHRRPKKRDRRSDGAPRARERYTFAVPVDEREKGADLIDDLLDQIEAKLHPDQEDPRSRYYTLVDGLNIGLLNINEEGA